MKKFFCCSSSCETTEHATSSTIQNRTVNKIGETIHGKIRVFSYKELKVATEKFSSANKIGEGAFGTVYKGRLLDGSVVAVKVLSVEIESMRGEREFISELTVLSNVRHENLVTLQGCCVDGANRYLVYDYLENNSLSHALFGKEQNKIKFNWELRRSISMGVARGIAHLHEEVEPYVLHRDIKASNILLDHDLTPKVADFGLSRIINDNKSYVSTRVAGTLGYLAPEYAISGHLTRKSDVYSFGVVLLEIISGRPAVDFDLEYGEVYLVQKAWDLYKDDKLVQLVDPTLGKNFPEEEGVQFLLVGLMCVQETAKYRPRMPTVVKMLTKEIDISDLEISQPGVLPDLMHIRLSQKNSSAQSTNTSRESINSSFPR